MAKYEVGDKVTIPATIVKVVSDETGVYYDLKVKANNKAITFNCEEEDIVSESESTSTDEATP